MSWHDVKIDVADKNFSRYVRLCDKKCLWCGRVGTGPDKIFGLQASHFYSRRKWNTRFDRLNVDSLDAGCHRYFGEHKSEYREFKINQLGQQEFDKLTIRANTPGKRDWALARLVTKQLLKELKG